MTIVLYLGKQDCSVSVKEIKDVRTDRESAYNHVHVHAMTHTAHKQSNIANKQNTQTHTGAAALHSSCRVTHTSSAEQSDRIIRRVSD